MSVSDKIKDLKQYMEPVKHRSTFDVPTSGQIAMSDIREVMGLSGQVSLRDMADLAGLPSGQVSLSDFYGYTPCDNLNYRVFVGKSSSWTGYASGSGESGASSFGTINCNNLDGATLLDITAKNDGNRAIIDAGGRIGTASQIKLTPTVGSETSSWSFVYDSASGVYDVDGFSAERFLDWLNEDESRTFKLEAL